MGMFRAMKFQSTLPKGSDAAYLTIDTLIGISIHAPQGERRAACCSYVTYLPISIHAPQGERPDFDVIRTLHIHFNPRSPRGATGMFHASSYVIKISIHAPQGERPGISAILEQALIISIHAPQGERPEGLMIFCGEQDFNPRSPRGATYMA